MTSKNTKIYKLKPTDGPLNRDDLSTWIFTAESYARQNGWSQFLPSGKNSKWVARDEDDNNGLTGDDADSTKKLRDGFKDFITAIAANCPTGFTDTVIRESTSFQWIEEKIKKTFNLTTKGENFLEGMNLKMEFNDGFTYSQGWMMIKDYYISSLLPNNSTCMGRKLSSKEVLSPLALNFLVREWLTKIDTRLPEHVRNSRGHLFTTDRPTLACNQEILCDQIDIMLQELDGKDMTSTNSVNVSYIPSSRGRGFPRGGGTQRTRYNRGGRGGGQHQTPRYQSQGRLPQQSCYLCLEARRYDSSITHSAQVCPFPPQRRNISRQTPPPFKVLLVPTTNPSLPKVDQATISDKMENLSHSNHLNEGSYQSDMHSYYDGADYDGQYNDLLEGGSQHYGGGSQHYDQATIEELPPL